MTLLKFVDDATKNILWMEIAPNESWRSIVKPKDQIVVNERFDGLAPYG